MTQCNNDNCPCKMPLLPLAVPMRRAEDFAAEALREELEGQRVGELEVSPDILLEVIDSVTGNVAELQRLAYIATAEAIERGDTEVSEEELNALLDYVVEEDEEVLRRLS